MKENVKGSLLDWSDTVKYSAIDVKIEGRTQNRAKKRQFAGEKNFISREYNAIIHTVHLLSLELS